MAMHFSYAVTVSAEAIDANRHVNNVEFVRWMQDAAVAHASAVGCTAATAAAGCTWVVRRHTVDYLRPVFVGDRVEVKTWIADYRRAFSTRHYEFSRAGESEPLARGETLWVYVDAATGRPKSIPAEMQGLFLAGPERDGEL
jgi:acyl-CoA thioester hydrolase